MLLMIICLLSCIKQYKKSKEKAIYRGHIVMEQSIVLFIYLFFFYFFFFFFTLLHEDSRSHIPPACATANFERFSVLGLSSNIFSSGPIPQAGTNCPTNWADSTHWSEFSPVCGIGPVCGTGPVCESYTYNNPSARYNNPSARYNNPCARDNNPCVRDNNPCARDNNPSARSI